jgi:tyrosyl-tRNA synthetase
MTIFEELEWRELVADCTEPTELQKRLESGPIVLYAGFDPTAESLHVGSLVPLLALRRFQLRGHHPIAVAGGATGLVGDPSGRDAERALLTKETLDRNIAGIKEQLRRLLDFECAGNPARLLDNADWTAPVGFLDFLRDIGKHFSVNQMMAKESVRARMADRESGLSYTEFSYMLLQAFDFCHLYQAHQCELQIGGSDQWGNITDGSKFGKSAAGAVWLDARKTSVYRFYQFWIRTNDGDVARYLKLFTFLGPEEIESLSAQHQARPEARVAHKALAAAMTDMIHGPAATAEAVRASEILFGGGLEGIAESTFNEIVGEVPTREVEKSKLEGAGAPLAEIMATSGLCPSKGQARKDIEGGGVYVNNIRESNPQRHLTAADLLFGKHLLLRKGKRNYTVMLVK